MDRERDRKTEKHRSRERDDRTMWRPHRTENGRVKSLARGVRL